MLLPICNINKLTHIDDHTCCCSWITRFCAMYLSQVLYKQLVDTSLHQVPTEMYWLTSNVNSPCKELFGTWGLKSLLVLRALNSVGCWKQKSSSCGILQASAWVVPAVNECLASGLQVGDFTGACMNRADFTLISSTAVVFSTSTWVFPLHLGGLG